MLGTPVPRDGGGFGEGGGEAKKRKKPHSCRRDVVGINEGDID